MALVYEEQQGAEQVKHVNEHQRRECDRERKEALDRGRGRVQGLVGRSTACRLMRVCESSIGLGGEDGADGWDRLWPKYRAGRCEQNKWTRIDDDRRDGTSGEQPGGVGKRLSQIRSSEASTWAKGAFVAGEGAGRSFFGGFWVLSKQCVNPIRG